MPFSVKLTDKFDLGLNGGVAWVRNDDSAGYHAEYITTASLSYEWTEQLSTLLARERGATRRRSA